MNGTKLLADRFVSSAVVLAVLACECKKLLNEMDSDVESGYRHPITEYWVGDRLQNALLWATFA